MGAALSMTFGIFGLAFAPTVAPWLWIVTFGLGNGALFPLAPTLPHDLADDERGRTLLTTWMLGLGYVVSGTGPLLVGGLLDLTGSFTVPMVLLGTIGIFSGICGLAPAVRRRRAAGAVVAATSS
jgi:CP family cyanate transporter-like MFS transporter